MINFNNDEKKNLAKEQMESLINFSNCLNEQTINEHQFTFLEEMLVKFLSAICNNKSEYDDALENILLNLKNEMKINFYLSLILFTYIDKQTKSSKADIQIPSQLFYKLFIDNEFSVSILYMIYYNICTSENYSKMFFLPNLDKIINLMFKIPEKIANLLEYSLINRHEYFYSLFHLFFTNENLSEQFFNKICKLKLLPILTQVLRDALNERKKYTLNFFKTIEMSIFYEDFLEALFNTKINTKTGYENISFLFKNISIEIYIMEYFSDKLIRIIQSNVNFISLVLLSNNFELINMYIQSLLNILKTEKEKIDHLDSFTFYIILFSIYFYCERIKKEDLLLKVLKGIFEMQGNILEKIFEIRMKKIFLLFSDYIKERVSSLMKDKELNDKNKDDEEILIKLDEEENKIFDFKMTEKELLKDPLYLSNLKEENGSKFLKVKHSSDHTFTGDNKSEKSKTKYISVKFQKQYGEFNREKQNPFLEINENKEDSINIKISSNLKSSLKLRLEKEDKFSDLDQLTTPIYLKDCLLGLSSQFPDRQKLSLQSLPDLINSKPLDLDYLLPQICETLLKLDNSFDLENFDDLITHNLTRLTVFNPVKMTELLCSRFFKEESGVKNKFQVLTVIEKSIEEISDFYIKNKKVPKINKLHCFFENIIFPLLLNLQQMNMEKIIVLPDFDYLLAKFITVISKLIKLSENHPFIYKALFESFELFKAIVNNKSFLIHKSLLLIDSLNLFASVVSKFVNANFLEIYPEFFPNFKVILTFLNDTIEKITKEELKVEMLKNLNNYLINLEKLKESFNKTEQVNVNLNII